MQVAWRLLYAGTDVMHSCQAAMKACRHIYGPSYMRVFEALP